MRIMAIDYGDAHTGIAISDATGTLAGFTTVITAYRPEAVAAEIQRLIAEHGVTELVTVVYLVRQQLRIASGLALRLRQEDVTLQGHAIECRINAEDPVQNFQPCPGTVEFVHFPGGAGVRVDSCLYSGCELSPYYDSMAAKILAYAPTRMETIRRMRRCLGEFPPEAPATNAGRSPQIPYHPELSPGERTTARPDEPPSQLLEFSRKLSESGVDA